MKIERFEDILSWQEARELTLRVYRISRSGDFSKDRELRDQMRRASGSVMHNIAEGFDGGSPAEFAKFLRYAQRSATEVRSQLYIAIDQKYIDQKIFDDIYGRCDKIHALIGGFIRHLERSATSERRSPTRKAP